MVMFVPPQNESRTISTSMGRSGLREAGATEFSARLLPPGHHPNKGGLWESIKGIEHYPVILGSLNFYSIPASESL